MNKKRVIIIALCILALLAIVGGLLYLFLDYLPEQKREREIREAFEEYYNAKIEQYERENPEKYGADVAFIGDSLTDGYDVEAYYPELTVANRGIGGDTTWGVEKRLQVSLFDLKPKVVVMLIGGNNWRDMFDNYEQILIKLKENLPDSKIILLSLTPTAGDFADKCSPFAFNSFKIKKLAEKYGYTFVDVYSPLLDVDNSCLKAEYTSDGVHFTAAGYEVITKTLKPVILSELGKE